MKPYLISISLILLIALATGWRNAGVIHTLDAENRELKKRARTMGMPTVQDPADQLPVTKRPRPDRDAEARNVAAEFIAYGTDMEALGANLVSPDAETRQRMITQIEQVISLGPDQTKILIETVRDAPDIQDKVRERLMSFGLEQIMKDDPRGGLLLLTPETCGTLARITNGVVERLFGIGFENWSKEDPEAALAWYRENSGTIPEVALQRARYSIIQSTAATDPRKALELVTKFSEDHRSVPYMLGRVAQSPEQKADSLAALREWLPSIADTGEREEVFRDSLRQILLGNGFEPADFDAVTRWVDAGNLLPDEMRFFEQSFTHKVKPEETGKWAEWMAARLPQENAWDQLRDLFTHWAQTDREAAGKWLADAPDGMVKICGIRAYALAIGGKEPQAALDSLLMLPPGEDQEESFRWLYRAWPKDDPADKKAAEAFAKKHGVR